MNMLESLICSCSEPWMTPEIMEKRRLRRRMEKRVNRTDNPADRQEYRSVCHDVSKLITAAKANYYRSLIIPCVGCPDYKILSKTVNRLLSGPKVQAVPTIAQPADR